MRHKKSIFHDIKHNDASFANMSKERKGKLVLETDKFGRKLLEVIFMKKNPMPVLQEVLDYLNPEQLEVQLLHKEEGLKLTVLHYAAALNDSYEAIQLLLDKAPKHILLEVLEDRDNFLKRTPLELAKKNSSQNICGLLADAYANICSLRDKNIDEAVDKGGDNHLISMLLKATGYLDKPTTIIDESKSEERPKKKVRTK